MHIHDLVHRVLTTMYYYGRNQCGVKITVHSVTEQQSDQLVERSFYTFNLLDISIAQYN